MDQDYRRAANITVIVIGIAAALWLFFKYTLSAVMPFLLAALIAGIVSSPAKCISKRLRLPYKLVSFTLVLLLFFAAITLIYVIISRLAFELSSLVDRLSSDPDLIENTIGELMEKLNSKDSKWGVLQSIVDSETLKNLGIDIGKMMSSAISSIASSLVSFVSSTVMKAISSVPSLLLSLIVFFIAAFYFATDSGTISSGLLSFLPDKWQKKLPHLKLKLIKTLTGYLKAYLLIMLITFLEVFVGLSVLGAEYAFILALIVAIVDLLPILGTGTVLVPWSVFAFLGSDIGLGIGLLVLYGVTIVVRQIIEPKIVGKAVGLHPLATLASVYIGLELLGFAGIFIGPIIVMFLFRKDTKAADEVAVTQK